MKSVTINCFKGRVIIEPYTKTTAGVLIGTGAIDVVPIEIPHEELGVMVRRALARTFPVVPHPTDFSNLADPVLKIAGVKSWSAFSKNSSTCSISTDNEHYEIVPYRKFGKRGGEVGIVEAKRILHNPSNEELGQAIQEALKVSAEAEPQY